MEVSKSSVNQNPTSQQRSRTMGFQQVMVPLGTNGRTRSKRDLDGDSRHSNKSSGSSHRKSSLGTSEMSNTSGHTSTSRRSKPPVGMSHSRISKQVQLKSKMMAGGASAIKPRENKDSKPTTSSSSRQIIKRTLPGGSVLQALREAATGVRLHMDSHSADAHQAMRYLNDAVDQMEMEIINLTQQLRRHQMEKHTPLFLPPLPKQSLTVRYTMFVEDPTLEASPFPETTLSRATYEANNPSEDRSTVVVGEDFIFAGVWDGHGGTSAAEFTQANLFPRFQKAYESGASVPKALVSAFTKTDKDYYNHARKVNKPQVFFAGTCAIGCYVDIKTGKVTCANLGDSRAVMGVYKKNGKMETIPLSVDHSADNLLEQTRLRTEHPDDHEVVVDIDDSGEDPDWRVKRLAAFTRSIGDLHLKEKNTSALFNSYVAPSQRILPRPGLKCQRTGVVKPKYISTEPEIKEATIDNGFIIIACDGVWDEMSSEEAVHIVSWLYSKYDPEEHDIAKLFIEETLKRAVRRIAATYEDEEHLTLAELKKRPQGKDSDAHRALLHDDITVVILQFGETERLRKQCGGSLFSMLQNNAHAQEEEFFDSQMSESQSMMSMTRTKTKRELAAQNSILDWSAAIDALQIDSERIETDNQILQMMNAFDGMDTQNLKILFNAVDADGNGTLDREEIMRLIKNVIMMDVNPGVIDLAFSEMDVDGSGDVDLEEFIQFFGK